jgi:hypothetical protein
VNTCQALVRGVWLNVECGKPGKVEVEGKWYCGIHDPVKVAKRRANTEAKWAAERDHTRQTETEMKALLDRLTASSGTVVGRPRCSGAVFGCDALVELVTWCETQVGDL